MVYRILPILLLLFSNLYTQASAEVPFKAAFIRDHQLWIKEGEKELQLTKGRNVHSPKWSKDGKFIAFLDMDDAGEKSNLYIYNFKQKQVYEPYPMVETSNFKWSPTSNQLAYNLNGILNVTKTKNGRPEGFENVSLGVSDFEWFPNGKEFIVSSQSNLLPTGWEPVHIFKVAADANLEPNKIKPFYTIQTNTTDLFAINAEYFKWSFDGKWVSFLATPTASWANDSNTLCALSSTGENFQALGKMLWYKDWFKWAHTSNKLAFISGEGRFFVENKNTTIIDMPTLNQQKVFTPKGYVDLDLDWLSPDEVVVARAKENKDWKEGPVPTMYTSLYMINVKSGIQKQITNPKKKERDIDPQTVGSYITWFRKSEKNEQGNVWLMDGVDGSEKIWLEKVDETAVFYNS